jgi:hypothetical protein
MKRLYALGDIARELGVEQHRVAYILKTRRWIQPVARVGSNRCFDGKAVKQIAAVLRGMDG